MKRTASTSHAFLRDVLAHGPLSARDVKKAADDTGYSWRTIQRAMKRAGAESRRQGFGKPALWSIPGHTVAPDLPPSRRLRQPPACGANGATDAEVAQLDGEDDPWACYMSPSLERGAIDSDEGAE